MATIEHRIYEGARAREMLENEVFQAVFTDIEQELYTAWVNSPQRDSEGRESLHKYLMMLNRVKAHLTTTMETGQLAELDLKHKRNLLESAKETWQQFAS